MASLGDAGDPPPLPDGINRNLSLEEAIQAANIAGLNPDAKGLGDVIRVTPQNEQMFEEFIKTQHAHPLIKNKRIYKNDDHAKDYIITNVEDLYNIRALMYKHCSDKGLLTHPDSIGPSVIMVGTALQDVRNTTRGTLWNNPIIPDHFLTKFMIRDDSLKQELTSSQYTLMRAC